MSQTKEPLPPKKIKTVFVVDDEPFVLHALSRVLLQEGFVVKTFCSAEEAWPALSREEPDCLISDYHMPKMDGLEFLGEVRQRHPGIVRVLLTGGFLEDRLTESLKKATMQFLLRKPWHAAAIRKLMEHIQAGRSGLFINESDIEKSTPEVQPQFPSANAVRSTFGKPRVLVVDDDPMFLKLMVVWLCRLGYEPVTTSSAQEAQAQLQQNEFNLVLLDLVMEGMGGLEFLTHIRKGAPRLPVVVITGLQDRHVAIDAFRAGATSFIQKPMEFSALEVTLRQCVDLDQMLYSQVCKPELAALLRVGHAVASGMDHTQVLDLFLQEMLQYTKADSASTLLVNPDKCTMRLAASYGLAPELDKNGPIAVGTSISGWVVEHNEPQIVIGSAENESGFDGVIRAKIPSVGMCLPMRGRKGVVGVLCLNRWEGQELFSQDAIDLGLILGQEVAHTLEQKSSISGQMDFERDMMRRDKLVTIGELASGVAHEINNPLGYVNSNVSSMRSYIEDLLPLLQSLSEKPSGPILEQIGDKLAHMDLSFILEDLPSCLQETEQGIKNVLRIVADLKSFARDDQETKESADINQVLDGAVNIVWNQIKYKSELRREYSQLPPIPCFPSQLGQVFLNLLYNAAQSIERDGLIVLRTGVEADAIFVEIQDNGHGMPPEVVERVFEPFFTTKPRGVGTGLGLKIAKKIIERHAGVIRVKSSKGSGSTFRIEIPLG